MGSSVRGHGCKAPQSSHEGLERTTGSEAMGVVILSMDIGMDAIGMAIEELWPAWRPYRPSSSMPMLSERGAYSMS